MAVALSASAGASVWRQVTRAYVSQLIQETSFSKAAAYLVALGEEEEAVKVLLEGRLFREAIILARLHSVGDISDILAQWSDRLTLSGGMAQAAKCQIARDQADLAIQEIRES